MIGITESQHVGFKIWLLMLDVYLLILLAIAGGEFK